MVHGCCRMPQLFAPLAWCTTGGQTAQYQHTSGSRSSGCGSAEVEAICQSKLRAKPCCCILSDGPNCGGCGANRWHNRVAAAENQTATCITHHVPCQQTNGKADWGLPQAPIPVSEQASPATAHLREAVRDAAADGLGLVKHGIGPHVQHLIARGLLPAGDARAWGWERAGTIGWRLCSRPLAGPSSRQ